MPYYTQTFKPITRIFGDCFKCLTSFQHFQPWQVYLKIVLSAWLSLPKFSKMTRIFGQVVSNFLHTLRHLYQWQQYLEIVSSAWNHSNIFNNDKYIWRLFRVPDIISTFSTMTRIFEDCIKCLITLRHLNQLQQYLEIVSSALNHSNIFNNEKYIWRLCRVPNYTNTFTPMTRIFGDCFDCL